MFGDDYFGYLGIVAQFLPEVLDVYPEQVSGIGVRVSLDFSQQVFTRMGIAAADEECGVFEIFRSAGKHGTMHECFDVDGSHFVVAHQFIYAGINGDDAVKGAGMLTGIQLNQYFFHESSAT